MGCRFRSTAGAIDVYGNSAEMVTTIRIGTIPAIHTRRQSKNNSAASPMSANSASRVIEIATPRTIRAVAIATSLAVRCDTRRPNIATPMGKSSSAV